MRVVLDLRFVRHGIPSGVQRYAQELARAMGNLPNGPELAVIALPGFSDPQLNAEVITAHSQYLSFVQNIEFLLSPPWRKFKPQLYHYPHFNAPPNGKLPLIATVHDIAPMYPDYGGWLKRNAFRHALNSTLTRAKKAICVSDFTYGEVVQNFPQHKQKLTVIGEAPGSAISQKVTPDEITEVLTRLGLKPSYVLYIGNAKKHKNLEMLLRAYAKQPEHLRRSFPLVLAGRPKEFTEAGLVQLAKELKIEKDLRLPGIIDERSIKAVYLGAHVLVLISIYESFGLPVVEAQASGVPCLLSRNAALPQTGGKAALYVDPLDEKDVTRHLRLILEDRILHDNLAKTGKELAQKRSWEGIAEQVLSLYHEVLEA